MCRTQHTSGLGLGRRSEPQTYAPNWALVKFKKCFLVKVRCGSQARLRWAPSWLLPDLLIWKVPSLCLAPA